MKPRNKKERALLQLAAKLPPITDRQRDWAYAHCFTPIAYYWPKKKEVKCMCCGGVTVWDKAFIESFIDVDQYDCPYCDKSMSIKRHSEENVWREHKHFTILTTFRGHQVARTFEVSRCNYKGHQWTQYDINEIFQSWIDDKGGETITGHPVSRSAFYCTWHIHQPMDIRQHNASCTGAFQMDDLYDICGNYLYPDVRVTPLLRRNGWRKELLKYHHWVSMTDAWRWLLSVPDAEMLIKTGQMDLFVDMIKRGNRTLPYRYAVCIANRRGYIVEDAQMWRDMLALAEGLGLDTHNPDVVCPENLYAAHDRLLERDAKRRRAEEALSSRAKAARNEKAYSKAKGKYLGVVIEASDLHIAPLQSVAEFVDESEAMHHCVFKNEYYQKPGSLILSARDSEGNRLETVELSLKTFRVLQSRAKFNQTSPRHAEIVELAEKNAKLFREVV